MNTAAERLNTNVKRILLHEWDPIGVSDIPEAADEYDAYALHVSAMLGRGCSHDELYQYLIWVEGEYMGLQPNEVHTRRIVNRLYTLGLSGTAITYRPADQASSSTSPTTATVEVNNAAVKAINNGKVAKFKFPGF